MSQSTKSLCKLEDLPKHLQFNKDILTGYRRPMTAKDCVHSWTYLHNETFNCYSHCFALFYFLYAAIDYSSVWPSNQATSAAVKLLILNDLICATFPFAMSVLYHTFMPHLNGENTYKRLLKVDILGVWWVCTFGPLSSIYTGLYCTPNLMSAYITLYMFLSAYVLFYLMVMDCKQKRTSALTAQFMLRVLLHPLRLSSLSHSSTSGVPYYMIMDIISAAGALINAFHVPERWWPGKLDYVCNGHTLMHIAAILCVIIARQGFLCDMQWMNEVGSCPSSVSDLGVSSVTDLGNGLIHALNVLVS